MTLVDVRLAKDKLIHALATEHHDLGVGTTLLGAETARGLLLEEVLVLDLKAFPVLAHHDVAIVNAVHVAPLVEFL